MPKKRGKKKSKNVLKEPVSFVSRHKYWIFSIIILAVLVFFFAGAKIALYVNFLLGNDVILSVDVDKEFLTLQKGQDRTIAIRSEVTTNPFCKASCDYRFEDLSRNKTLDQGNFILRSGIANDQEYTISAVKDGEGIELYRYHIECKGLKSILCHTGEDVVTRSNIMTLNYKLNDQDQRLKESLRTSLALTKERLSDINGKQEILKSTTENLKTNKILSDGNLEQFSSDIERAILEIKDINTLWIEQNYDLVQEKLKVVGVSALEARYEKIDLDLINLTQRYNNFVDDLKKTRGILVDSVFDSSADIFEKEIKKIITISTLEYKENLLLNITKTIDIENSTIHKKINYTCSLITCNITEDLCTDLKEINEKLESVNYTAGNITLERLDECNFSQNISSLTLEKVNIDDSYSAKDIGVDFKEPIPDCCLFGKCKNCCVGNNCSEENYPVVFLHGHAVNKDLSAEYSLEGFNQIQDQLEEDGYLNAGAVTLYTLMDTPEGLWGMFDTPLAIRASYYFDIFEEPENYYVVQAKSENIDTYAIRLNDLIKTIKFKTGKDKVRIVAFSMGGLVARKYIQIFGTDDTDRLIMIGTPNHGTDGGISDYCSLLGESLECRDLDSQSLFINRLNRQPLPKIPIYNIYGTGCDMKRQDGDGAVTAKSARLEGATNFIIEGQCRGRLLPLHLDLRNLDLYPEVYNILKESLEE